MLSPNIKLAKNGNLPGNCVEGQALLLDLDEKEAIQLNPVAAEIWNAVDGQKTAQEIVARIQGLFDGDPKQIEKEVLGFLKKLLRQEIILEKRES